VVCITHDMRANCRPGENEIAEIATRQHGVIAARQLIALGLTPRAVQYWMTIGRLHRLYPGVYAVGHTRLTLKGRWMAAVLAGGERAVLSHGDAAALWDLLPPKGSRVHVTTPRGLRARRGIVLHQVRSLHPEDRTVRDGIPVTSLARTLLDVAEADPARLSRAYDEADRQRLIDIRALSDLCDRSPGRHGLKALRALIQDENRYGPDTKGEFEARFFDFCREYAIPLPACNVLIEGFLVDAAWPESKLIVELDSYAFHRHQRAFEEDRRRDGALFLAGYRVPRVTWRRLTQEPDELARLIRGLL
jgi:hypothetical protein